MKLRINYEDGNYYEISTNKETHGFTVYSFKKTEKEDAKNSHSKSFVGFFPKLEQVAKKLTYLGLEGHNLGEVMQSIKETEKRLTDGMRGLYE